MTRLLFASLSACLVCVAAGADWLQFRGPGGTGVSADTNVPVQWDDKSGKNIAWKVELPGRGLSAPVIVGNRVFVTAASGQGQDRLHVVCFDAASGKQLWHRQMWATGSLMTHPKTCIASSTPVSDGRRLFVTFSSNDTAAFDLDGNLLWFRGLTHDYPNAANSLGMASSPTVADDTLILQLENDSQQSIALGLDAATGRNRWKLDRPVSANWVSPVVLEEKPNQKLVLLQSRESLIACRPATGETVWTFAEGCSTMSSSAVVGDVVIVPSSGLTALKHKPGSAAPEVIWQEGKLSPSTVSPTVHNGRVYTVTRAAILRAADLKTGEVVWDLRLKGPFSSTPVIAGNHLFVFNEEGFGQVVDLSAEEGEILPGGNLGETILGTPAVAGGGLYIRSDGHLWKIGATP